MSGRGRDEREGRGELRCRWSEVQSCWCSRLCWTWWTRAWWWGAGVVDVLGSAREGWVGVEAMAGGGIAVYRMLDLGRVGNKLLLRGLIG